MSECYVGMDVLKRNFDCRNWMVVIFARANWVSEFCVYG